MQEADVSAPILVAYSPKSGDRGPVNFAEAAARATGAPIVVLAAEAGGADAAGQLRAELGLGDDVEVRAPEGSPTRAIAAAVEELKPGLLVVGSTHRGGFGRIMPGSTAERLIHGSAAPVVVVPHQHEVRAGGARTVAAGFENTDEGRTALRVAAGLARSLGAKLLAVLVLSPKHAEEQAPGLLARTEHDQSLSENRHTLDRLSHQDALTAAIAEFAEGVETEPDVLFQEPAEGLEAASHRADLMVIGARAHGPMHSVALGGTGHKLITTAACPLLVLPRGLDALSLTAGSSASAGSAG
jgi:nucleotide-binding universal stress UspA family protein